MSPTILPSALRLVPTSSSTAPGFTMSAVISPADPAAAITMSPVRTTAARSVVPVWHWVTVAFSVPPGEQQPHRPARGHAAADDDHVCSGDRYVVPAEELDAALRGARQRAVLAEDELAEADRVQAVGVLGRVDQAEDLVRVDVLGERELDDEAGAVRVLVELADLRGDLVLGRVGRQLDLDRGDPDRRAVAVLAGHVRPAARVVPDQDRAEPGDHALLGQLRDPDLQLVLDRRRRRLTVQNLRRHDARVCHAPRPLPPASQAPSSAPTRWSRAAPRQRPRVGLSGGGRIGGRRGVGWWRSGRHAEAGRWRLVS